MTDFTDYTRCALCTDWAKGGISLSVTYPTTASGRTGKTVTKYLCPQCAETVHAAQDAKLTDEGTE